MQTTPWNKVISQLYHPHLLQTSQWAAVKSSYGWTPHFLVWCSSEKGWQMIRCEDGSFSGSQPEAAGLLLERRAFPGLSVLYMPKGPLMRDPGNWSLWEQILEDLELYARQRGALELKIDPDVEIGRGVPGEDTELDIPGGTIYQDLLLHRGWRFSQEQIQFRNTVLVDLEDDEDRLLARMKSKTRYNIRLAGRRGITVRGGSEADFTTLYRMYAETAARGGFTIRDEAYYKTVWRSFLVGCKGESFDPSIHPLIAEYEGKPVAGAVIFAFGGRAWFLYGMSTMEHSEKMPTYLVQWEAMRWAKAEGCDCYDMWGAPDNFNKGDSLWGVYRFKRGFGGEVSRTAGAWDFPAKPLRYTLYNRGLPRILDLTRWFADRRTRRIADNAMEN